MVHYFKNTVCLLKWIITQSFIPTQSPPEASVVAAGPAVWKVSKSRRTAQTLEEHLLMV